MPTSLHVRLGATLCAALALSACGGSHHRDGQDGQSGTDKPPVVANDSFFDYVMARVGALIDNEEPASIDGVTETKPEDTEPKPVG
jgi:hypothetical protein